jgi:hypothetical protein
LFIFEVSGFFNVGTYSYKFFLYHGLFCVPQILVHCIFIFFRFLELFDLFLYFFGQQLSFNTVFSVSTCSSISVVFSLLRRLFWAFWLGPFTFNVISRGAWHFQSFLSPYLLVFTNSLFTGLLCQKCLLASSSLYLL